jgi:dipeptidyl aminopeptidase/acylaminoacyl peptidase
MNQENDARVWIRTPRLRVETVLLLLCGPFFSPASTLSDEATAAEFEIPAAIETEGVPPIPKDIQQSVTAYQDIEHASFQDWNPAGDGILIGTRHGNLVQLHHVKSPGVTPTVLTTASEPARGGRYLPDGRILFSRSAGGNEQYQVFRLDPNTGKETMLTDGSSRNLLGRVHPDGAHVAMTSTRRNGRDADIYLQPVDGSDPKLLYEVDRETWYLASWSPDGKRAILSRYVSHNETYARILDVETLEARDMPTEIGDGKTMTQSGVARFEFQFGPDGKNVFLTSDARGEFHELARLNLETGKTDWLSSDIRWDVEDLKFSRDRKRCAFTVNADGYSELYLVDGTDTPEPTRKKIDLERRLIGSAQLSPDGTRLGLTLGRATGPAESYGFDIETGKLTRWTTSNPEEFEKQIFVDPQLFHYQSFDEREIPAFLFVPPKRPASTPVPVVITIHGGPESQFRPWFSLDRQYIARELGAAVIAPNVRGSTGYGKTYSKLDNGMLREDSVKDIGALLDWIRDTGAQKFGLDPNRVAVKGGSYGGYMVLASLIHFGDRLRAGIDNVGISDFITFLENTRSYRRNLRRVEYGDERDPEMRGYFESISPARQIGRLRSALLLIHGKNDPRVPLSEAQQVVRRARSSGKEVWTIYADNEGHGFHRKENRIYRQAASAVFLRRFLLPLGNPEGDDRPQREKRLGGLYRQIAEHTHNRAGTLFELERFDLALKDYDASIAIGLPHDKYSCWERGLVYYYLGRYREGARQFEGYHTVGPKDIENGIWRYLCIAESDALDKAVETFYPYPEKIRVPFPTLHALYTGTGTVESVLEEAESGPPGRSVTQMFYGHYYIGKYLEIKRDFRGAQEHFEKALTYKIGHFMYDCARIDRKRNGERLK